MTAFRRVHGAEAAVTIVRDRFGIAHVFAENEHDAWFGQGYAAAEDRLWQMECDRRRAAGRWAEAAGPDARFAGVASVQGDIMARRLRLEDAARADVAVMSPETLAIYEAYAAGVNAFLASDPVLPPEYALCGIEPEPWDPWHSVAVFKIRHVSMGMWQSKVAWGEVLARAGSAALAKLGTGTPPGSSLILPPGATFAGLMTQASSELEAAAESLGFLAGLDGGSNSWAIHGSRTTTGRPVICNDSHRGLDVPNAYWQVHVACPAFNVIGATFAGQPGFPHFGYNGSVAWNITHTQADYQDLYVERFREGRYETEDGWGQSSRRVELIRVRGAADVTVETWATRHGPVVHGDPRSGLALSMRYTATDEPCRQWEAIRPMMAAPSVEELFETQRPWVEPVNNLVAADAAGNIGYLTRGRLPVRTSRAARLVPAPGWDGRHEWAGDVPFQRMPRSINPPEGFIATANQRVIAGDEPHISDMYAPPYRGDRLAELFRGGTALSPEEIAAVQGDRVSIAARAWCALAARSGPLAGDAEQARAMLAGWDANLLPESREALLYAFARREITRSVVGEALGAETGNLLFSERNPAYGRLLAHWLSNVVYRLDGELRDADPLGRPWSAVLQDALARAWQSVAAKAGPDPAAWRWDQHHGLGSKHPLSPAFPGLDGALDPPAVPVGGDGDTVQAAAYGWSGKNDFVMTGLSVYRQVVDFATGEGSFVIPGGVSGVPGTPHFADQLEHWRTHRRIPMHLERAAAEADAESITRLEPA